MESPAFLAFPRTAYDEVRIEDEIAQFHKIIADAEIGVVLINLAFKQADAVRGAGQPLVSANYADIVPHESAQFIPVVSYDDFFVGVDDTAFVPMGQSGCGGRLALFANIASGGFRHH